jgi:hypothetical protein
MAGRHRFGCAELDIKCDPLPGEDALANDDDLVSLVVKDPSPATELVQPDVAKMILDPLYRRSSSIHTTLARMRRKGVA